MNSNIVHVWSIEVCHDSDGVLPVQACHVYQIPHSHPGLLCIYTPQLNVSFMSTYMEAGGRRCLDLLLGGCYGYRGLIKQQPVLFRVCRLVFCTTGDIWPTPT